MKRAVFLDRDNTLIYDPGFIHEPEKVRLLNGVPEGLKLLKEAGFLLIVVSNQSGIGRGLFKEENFWAVNRRLNELLKPHGVQIDDFLFCPHAPWEGCSCRKPSPKLLLEAASKWNVELQESFMVGDRESDFEAGVLAGCRGSFLVGRPPFKSLLEVALAVTEGL